MQSAPVRNRFSYVGCWLPVQLLFALTHPRYMVVIEVWAAAFILVAIAVDCTCWVLRAGQPSPLWFLSSTRL